MKLLKSLAVCSLTLILTCTLANAKTFRFGVPPWPGVTVKTEITMQLLQALGYETQSVETGPPVIYNSLPTGDLDAFMGAWLPQQDPMLKPLLTQKAVTIATTNLSEALISLAVPKYVWDAGVRSIADLAKHAEKFDSTVYNIEPGAGVHTAMENVIKNNVAKLGKWDHVGSTTPMMLAQVQDLIKQNKWVVFAAWKPHWMNELIDMKYLTGIPGTEKLVSQSTVLTVVNNDLATKHPQVFRLLSQIQVSAAMQNNWIYNIGYKKRPAEEIAKEWIANNMNIVAQWLSGVKDIAGNDAIATVKQKVAMR